MVLEKDDDGQRREQQQRPEHAVDRGQGERAAGPGQDVRHRQDQDPRQHPERARPAEDAQDLIDDDRQDEDVEERAPSEPVEVQELGEGGRSSMPSGGGDRVEHAHHAGRLRDVVHPQHAGAVHDRRGCGAEPGLQALVDGQPGERTEERFA